MPLQKTVQVNPIILNKNIAIGIEIPFSSPSAFQSTYDFKTQLKYNLINLLLTNKGERIFNPNFGTDIRKQLFNQITEITLEALSTQISDTINLYIPEVIVEDLNIKPEPDFNAIYVTLTYRIKISNEKDTITINFE
jgi:phage baseplate assembly protein W